MKIAIAAALAIALAPAVANAADNFTFVTTGKLVGAVRVPAEGPNFQGANVQDSSAAVTYADGKKETVPSRCAAWRTPPGGPFVQEGVCVSAGNYEQNYSCAPRVAPKQGVNCWGILKGLPGSRFAGRTGLVTWTSGPEGTFGVGRWDD